MSSAASSEGSFSGSLSMFLIGWKCNALLSQSNQWKVLSVIWVSRAHDQPGALTLYSVKLTYAVSIYLPDLKEEISIACRGHLCCIPQLIKCTSGFPFSILFQHAVLCNSSHCRSLRILKTKTMTTSWCRGGGAVGDSDSGPSTPETGVCGLRET